MTCRHGTLQFHSCTHQKSVGSVCDQPGSQLGPYHQPFRCSRRPMSRQPLQVRRSKRIETSSKASKTAFLHSGFRPGLPVPQCASTYRLSWRAFHHSYQFPFGGCVCKPQPTERLARLSTPLFFRSPMGKTYARVALASHFNLSQRRART